MKDVASTLDRLGIVVVRQSGDELVAACPKHFERTGKNDAHPSWSINSKTGLFNCFSCGYKGGLSRLVLDLNGDIADLDQAKEFIVRPPITEIDLPDPYAVAKPEKTLDESILGRFTTPPRWARERRHITSEACATYGVLWELQTESWILPIRHASSHALLGWQEKSETSRRFRNFPAGVKKSRTVFGVNVANAGTIVVVESPLDAVRLHALGYLGAVAAFGAQMSSDQLLLLTDADEIVFALDNPRVDDAGRQAVTNLLRQTRSMLRAVRFFDYSHTDAKDIGDMDEDEIHVGIESAKSRAYGMAVL